MSDGMTGTAINHGIIVSPHDLSAHIAFQKNLQTIRNQYSDNIISGAQAIIELKKTCTQFFRVLQTSL